MNEKVQIATKNSWEYIKNWLGFNLEINHRFLKTTEKKEKPELKYVSTFGNAHVKENWIEINKFIFALKILVKLIAKHLYF